MRKFFLLISAISGAAAVIMGAFGAHMLSEKMGDYELRIWTTAVQYQFYHSIALMGLSLFSGIYIKTKLKFGAWFFISGIVLFCGSLYFLALRNILNLQYVNPGILTPMGGLAFILGWFSIAWHALTENV